MTPNFNTSLSAKNRGRRKGTVLFIVLHDTAGSGTDNDAKYLATDPEHRKISVDFCVGKSGTIFQLNDDLKGHCTFHAGRHTHFRDFSNGEVNQHSVGIEISQKADMRGLSPAYPDEQVKSVAQLCQWLCTEFHLSKTDITTHSKIITDGSRSDPRQFPWDSFWAYFNGTNDDRFASPITYVVQAGDTLYALAQRYTTTVERLKALNNMNDASNDIRVGQTITVKE